MAVGAASVEIRRHHLPFPLAKQKNLLRSYIFQFKVLGDQLYMAVGATSVEIRRHHLPFPLAK